MPEEYAQYMAALQWGNEQVMEMQTKVVMLEEQQELASASPRPPTSFCGLHAKGVVRVRVKSGIAACLAV